MKEQKIGEPKPGTVTKIQQGCLVVGGYYNNNWGFGTIDFVRLLIQKGEENG